MTRDRSILRWIALAACLSAAVLLVAALLRPGVAGEPVFHGTPYDPPATMPTATLIDHTGREVALADYRGVPALLFFGFTHCPDVCPLTLSRLSRILSSLEEEAGEMRILLVTVDPERDTPEALADYVDRFGPRVTGLTADPETLRRLRAEYGVYAEPPPAAGNGHHGTAPQDVAHTDAVFGTDRDGQLRVLLHPDAPEEHLREDIRTLLRL